MRNLPNQRSLSKTAKSKISLIIITLNIISHDNKDGLKENTTKKDESTSTSKASPAHQQLSTSTGIQCKDKPVDSRLEMRGTNYWTLYNYIPADEVKIYF